LKEASVLGFKRGIIPSQSVAAELPSTVETLGVRDLREAEDRFFA